MISRDPLKTRLALSVLAEGKAAHGRNVLRTSHIAWSRENTQDWDLSLFIYFTTFLVFIVTDGCQVRGAKNDA